MGRTAAADGFHLFHCQFAIQVATHGSAPLIKDGYSLLTVSNHSVIHLTGVNIAEVWEWEQDTSAITERICARPSVFVRHYAPGYRVQLLLGQCHCIGLLGCHRLCSLLCPTAAHPQWMMAV
jgi:hypothetical protein